MNHARRRRSVAALILTVVVAVIIWINPDSRIMPVLSPDVPNQGPNTKSSSDDISAVQALEGLDVKGRAAKTGYSRSEFGQGWLSYRGCDMRNFILARDLKEVVRDQTCRVITGVLEDPYTGTTVKFMRGPDTSQLVQIDHVVSLSDAWQKGAQQLTAEQRLGFANDPLNLMAVDGRANQNKADHDAASWLPSNRAFRCQFVARQIAVKHKYALWVTQAERAAMLSQLSRCPGQMLPAAYVQVGLP